MTPFPYIKKYLALTVKLSGMAALSLLAHACSLAEFVPKDKYLLYENEIECTDCEDEEIDISKASRYYKQKPNRDVLGVWRFHLRVYNLFSRKDKTYDERTGIDKWLFADIARVVGEPPVIWDSTLNVRTTKQIKLFLNSKGYYGSNVRDSVVYHNKREDKGLQVINPFRNRDRVVTVYYLISLGKPYRIGRIIYHSADKRVEAYILKDSSKTLLKQGMLLDLDVLEEERTRLNKHLRDRGYYNFSKDYITYKADTSLSDSLGAHTANIEMRVLLPTDDNGLRHDHYQYRIANVYMNMDYDPKLQIKEDKTMMSAYDTVHYQGNDFIYKEELFIKPKVLYKTNFIKEGKIFQLSEAERTYKHITSLKTFKLVNIDFKPVENDTLDSTQHYLNAHINLSPYYTMSYSADAELTYSSGDWGVASSILYEHRNLFNGAERLTFRVHGGLQNLTPLIASTETKNDERWFNTREIGAETALHFPDFYFLPFLETENFYKKFNPKTVVKLGYNYQERPDYTRSLSNLKYGYYWRGNRMVTHSLNPLEIHSILIYSIDSSFASSIEDYYISNSFKNNLITATSYTMNYNEQDINKAQDFRYIRYHLEFAGNTLYALSRPLGLKKEEGAYQLFGTRFSQYVKSDIDFRYYDVFNKEHSVVYRLFLGAGYPYGNAIAMPFEKKYFSGGSNSIRAWQVRSLGPGSYVEEDQVYANQMADLKLEMNIEYRFFIIWVLEGAFFVDAGNIWAITSADDRPGAVLQLNRFYKEIAVGTGLGARLDFSFFVFRLDLGIKTVDPAQALGKRWVLTGENLGKWSSYGLNFGIGYPF